MRKSEPAETTSKLATPVEAGPDATEPGASPTLSPETLSAIDSFLARTAHFEADSPEGAGGAKPENERNDSWTHQKKTSATVQESADRSPVVAEGSLIEPAPDTHGRTVAANERVEIEAPATMRPAPTIPRVVAVSVRAADRSVGKASPETETERIAANSPANADAIRPRAAVAELFHALRNREEGGSTAAWNWKVSFAERLLTPFAEGGTQREGDHSEQPFWQDLVALIDGLAETRDGHQAPSKTAQAALERLRREMSEMVDPEIATVVLCRKVVTYGVYEEAVAEDFVAGRPIQTIVYSEIRHLRSQELGDGLNETRLAARLELFRTDGASVWSKEEPDVVDRCRRVRSDFFIAQRISLPATLPAGDYVLKVFVEDKIADRATESSLPVQILSAASLVRG